MFENIFNPILDRFNYPQNDRQYVMMYYLNGINAIVVEWLRNGCEKSIKDVEQLIIEVLGDQYIQRNLESLI